MRTQLNDIEAAYTMSGHGPAVVLIHGLAEDRESWANVQQNVRDYCMHAVDLRGHGETSLGAADGTLAQLGGDLIAFLEKVTGPATCVGYSLGGTVLLWAAAQRPDLIPHVVVAGTSSVVGRAAVGFFESRIERIQQDFGAFSAALKDDTAAQLVTERAQLDEVAGRRVAAINDGQGYVNAARAMVRLASDPLTPLLSKIKCPVDAIYADQDVFCPEKAVDILVNALPHTTRRKINGAGHLMSIDQPQAYADTIRAALDAGVHQESTEPRK
jgi:pimeloyl-ACP methyl ester carboxylesterase